MCCSVSRELLLQLALLQARPESGEHRRQLWCSGCGARGRVQLSNHGGLGVIVAEGDFGG